MQRLEAKNPPERPLLSAETGNVENRRQDPRRNGLFSIDDRLRGSGRLDGGVRSQIRTRLPVIWPISGWFWKKTASRWPKMPKSAAAPAFSNICWISITGRNRERGLRLTASVWQLEERITVGERVGWRRMHCEW